VIQRRKITLVAAVTVLAILLLVVILGDNGLLGLYRQHAAYQMLCSDNAALSRENLQLYRTIDRLQNDPSYVENVARREMGMIRADELIFQFQTTGESEKPKK
jgi:cell division protein FtsB